MTPDIWENLLLLLIPQIKSETVEMFSVFQPLSLTPIYQQMFVKCKKLKKFTTIFCVLNCMKMLRLIWWKKNEVMCIEKTLSNEVIIIFFNRTIVVMFSLFTSSSILLLVQKDSDQFGGGNSYHLIYTVFQG